MLFGPNELAYLALTSKPEFAVRDKLAFYLHNALSENEYIVAREWKRSDLVVLLAGKPQVIVELKAMYHFNVLNGATKPHPYQSRVEADVQKALRLAEPETEVYALLLSTHPHSSFSFSLSGVIKYLSHINRAYQQIQTQEEIRERAIRHVQEWFDGAEVTTGTIEGGTAFGARVDVDYWLVGPYP
jgi:hypothetical protein